MWKFLIEKILVGINDVFICTISGFTKIHSQGLLFMQTNRLDCMLAS